MTLTAIGGMPLIVMPGLSQGTRGTAPTTTSVTIDAVNEAIIMTGRVWTTDGASHTIDTTGSSALEWRGGATTMANAGTTVKVGLATIDAAAGPPVKATAVADVITFSVSKSLVGNAVSPIPTNSWQTNVPDAGTLAVANGDLIAFCIQMTARGGVDTIVVATVVNTQTLSRPAVTSFVGAAYADAATLPNAVITFSDGVRGYFFGGDVFTTARTIQTWSNSGTAEYGNFLQLPFPVKVYGLQANVSMAGATSDFDLVLYSDPLGTPVAQKTVSIDSNSVALAGSNGANAFIELFASPYTTTADQPLAAIIKPTTANNISVAYKSFNSATHRESEPFGTNGYAVTRTSGAFAAVNSNKDLFTIGLIVGAFDNAVSGAPVGQQVM